MSEEEQITKAEELLLKHGFKISISGCGCCGSPAVRLSYKGKDIIGSKDKEFEQLNIDMFKEEL